MAAQLTLTNAWSFRALTRWMARAISSLPVPVSPRIKTLASVAATVSTSFTTLAPACVLATLVNLYSIDCIANAMVNPIYILALGGLMEG